MMSLQSADPYDGVIAGHNGDSNAEYSNHNPDSIPEGSTARIFCISQTSCFFNEREISNDFNERTMIFKWECGRKFNITTLH